MLRALRREVEPMSLHANNETRSAEGKPDRKMIPVAGPPVPVSAFRVPRRSQRKLFNLRAAPADLCEGSGMNPVRNTWRVWPCLLLAVASSLGAAAKPAGKPAPGDYAAFKTIATRNIFNSTRRERRPVAAKPPRVDSFALTGTLSYEKGTFAFFDGSSSAYRKVLKPEGTIAGYKVTDISSEAAMLEANGKQIELRVGGQLRRVGQGEWAVATNPVAYAMSSKRKSTVAARSGSSKADNRRKPASRHGHSGGSDSGQFSKNDLKAFVKAEKEMYSKEEMGTFSEDEMQAYSGKDFKGAGKPFKQLMQQ